MKKKLDISVIIITLAIISIGNLLIFSAASGGIYYMQKQIIYFCVGAALSFVFFLIPSTAYEKLASKLYGLNFIILSLVLIIGTNINGARRWFSLGFMNLQPSELSKIFIIICLSVYLYRRRNQIKEPKTFWSSLLYVIIPTALIFKEPDLGTSIVIMTIWFVMNFIMGTDIKNIIVCILIFATLISCVWFIPGVLKPYQRDRIVSFVNPEGDSLDSGYHVAQSKIAIGSGEIKGKGFLKGGQRKLKFIPEQHTDFIFTVLGEEWGFFGAVFLLILYGLLIYRFLVIAIATQDFIGKGIVIGVTAMFVFHIFINIGMTLGIMPVTGLPLALVSYGGTSLITNLIAIGLVENVAYHSNSDNFFQKIK